jgi:hypothetical protein
MTRNKRSNLAVPKPGMSKQRAKNFIKYVGDKEPPEGVSLARWRAMVAQIKREQC